MRKLAIVLSLLALVPFTVAACGDDDDEETEAPTTTEEPADTGGGAGDGGGAGGTVAVEADPGGELAFVQDSLEAPAGEVTFEFTNDSSQPHDFVIEDDSGEIARTDVITGDSTSTTAELQPGEYTFYCSVDAHREAGMEGPLTVE